MTTGESLQQLLSPLLNETTPKSWLFSTSTVPLPPTAFSTALPISIQQEAICQTSTLATGTTVEQLIIPSHTSQDLLYGFVYASGAKFSETDKGRRRSQSRNHALEARFCYDVQKKEFVMVQSGDGKRGAMSFRRLPHGGFRKAFFVVQFENGVVGPCSSARCVVGEIENDDYERQQIPESGYDCAANGSDSITLRSDSESCDSICEKVRALETTIKGSFFSLSSTEHVLCGESIAKRELGRELTIIGDVDAMMITELRNFAAATHYSGSLSPRLEEKMDIGVRKRLAAWRSLQRRNLRNYGEKWELKSLRGLRIALEKRYEVLRKERELLRLLLDR